MKKITWAWVAAIVAVASSAVADEAKREEADRWRLPACAPADSDEELRTSTGCSGVFGVRGSGVTVHGARAGTGAGVTASEDGEELVRRGIWSAHGLHRLAIGGGGAGFEGTLEGSMAGGFRIPVGERHGPVVRAGVQGYLRGNDAYFGSLLELPQLQLGYQYMRGTTVFEIAVTSGVVLTGRERVGDAERRVLGNGLEAGGYVVVQGPWLRLGMRAMRLPTHDALGPDVAVTETTLCVIRTPIAICADGRAAFTQAIPSPAATPIATRSFYGGLTLGLSRER
jgi:hypothetical protein